MPEIMPMLREDIQNALFESGGAWTSLALQNMKKLDSFLKEVLRCSPLGAGEPRPPPNTEIWNPFSLVIKLTSNN